MRAKALPTTLAPREFWTSIPTPGRSAPAWTSRIRLRWMRTRCGTGPSWFPPRAIPLPTRKISLSSISTSSADMWMTTAHPPGSDCWRKSCILFFRATTRLHVFTSSAFSRLA